MVFPLPPDEVLESASIDPSHVVSLDGRIPNWRVVVAGQRAVLKREWRDDESDVEWEHAFLTRLAATGFPAPRPLMEFAGRSWMAAQGSLWTLVTFQPGHTLAGRGSQTWPK